jgi:hypothetical protein
MNWRKAWWNCKFHKRANLEYLPEELRLANDPWFILKREHIYYINNFTYYKTTNKIFKTVCSGGLANESLFAIILYVYKQINDKNINNNVISAVTHATDWSRMESSTSPHLFKNVNELDIKFIDNIFNEHKYVSFIRKISPEFPDSILNEYIYNKNKKEDDLLILNEPFIFKYNRFKIFINNIKFYLLSSLFIYILFYLLIN